MLLSLRYFILNINYLKVIITLLVLSFVIGFFPSFDTISSLLGIETLGQEVDRYDV